MSVIPSVPTTVSIELRPGYTLAAITGKMFDEQACRDLDKVLVPAAKRHGGAIVLDLSGVKFVPSLAIGALLGLMKTFRESGQNLTIAAVQPMVRQVFTITKVDKVLAFCDTVEQAVQRTPPASGAAPQASA
jgi:anti-anti-sigma factor